MNKIKKNISLLIVLTSTISSIVTVNSQTADTISFNTAVDNIKHIDVSTAESTYDQDFYLPAKNIIKNSQSAVRLVSDITGIDSISLQDDNDTKNALLEYFRAETEAFSQMIDVSNYNIKVAEPNDPQDYDSLDAQAKKIYELLVFSSPRSYYLMQDNGTYAYNLFDYDFRSDGTYLTFIEPVYFIDVYDQNNKIDPSKVEAIRPIVEEKQKTLDNEVKYAQLFINYGMTDTEKLAALQYMINLRYSYSYEDFLKPSNEQKNNTAIQLVENKTGMCLAYATLFNYLAMEVGISDTGFVTSKDSNGNDYHTWNLVKAKTPAAGNVPHWYHIDVTWDDTINEGYGRTGMAYFFLSTDKINESHNIFENGRQTVFAPTEEEIQKYTGEPTDTTFDDALWHNSATVMVPYAEKWYFIIHQSDAEHPSVLYRYDPRGTTDSERYTELFTFKEEWMNGNQVLDHSYTGLGLVNGVLYFNCPTSIHSYDLINGKPGKEIKIDLPQGYDIFSSYIAGSTMYYGINLTNNPNNEEIKFGGTYKLADITMADAKLRNNHLVFKLDTYAPENKSENVTVIIKDGSRLLVENRKVNSYIPTLGSDTTGADPQSSWFTFDLEETDADNPPVIYIWGDNQKAFISYFCIDNKIYRHNGNGGADVIDLS